MKKLRKPGSPQHKTLHGQKTDVDIVDWLLAIDLDASTGDKRAYYTSWINRTCSLQKEIAEEIA